MELLNLRTDKNVIRFELKGAPVSFANALRRICLEGIPTVVLKDVQILENSSQLPHEMLRHRVEMLPLNVRASETRILSETKVELRVPALDKVQDVTTDHFTIHGDRKDVLLKDDMGHALLFLRLGRNEGVHITARLGLEVQGESQVSTVSYNFHIDPEQAREDKDAFLAEVPENEKELRGREFDNFYIQRSYARDAKGQANWYDFFLESWGVLSPKDIVRQAGAVLKHRVQEWAKTPITREGSRALVKSTETHTVGALVQRVLVDQGVRAYYDVPHPLLAQMILGFETEGSPEAVVQKAVETILGWCDSLDAQLSRQ